MNTPGTDVAYSLRALARDIGTDLVAHARHGADFHGTRLGGLRRISIFLTPPMLCIALFRVSHWVWAHGHERLAFGLCHFNLLLHRAMLHPASRVGAGFYIPHTVGVIFEGHAGRNLVLFANATVVRGREHPYAWDGHAGAPTLGDDVVAGTFAIVSGPIRVGNRVRIGPRAALQSDAPDDGLVVGSTRTRISPGLLASSPAAQKAKGSEMRRDRSVE